jgi:hypothetical protein
MYIAEADARVSEIFPSTNYGAQSSLLVSAADRSAQISYIRFTVTGLSETVQSVKLRIYCTINGTVDGPALYLAENDWIEQGAGSLTWSAQPALLSDIPVDPGAILTDSWIEYDVTDLVMEDGTYTFALVTDGPDGVIFSSREGTEPPQLIVTFNP